MNGTINRPWAIQAIRRCTAICAGAAILAVAWTAPAVAEGARERALEKRVEQLEKKLGSVEKLLLEMRASLEAAQAAKAPARTARAAPAPAQKVVKSGKSGVELTISGQVNRAVLIANDGKATNIFHVDNDNSSTRVRFVAKAPVSDDFTVGGQVEVEFESNSSATVNQLADERVGPNSFRERKLEIYLDHKRFGRLWLGQGDTATNNTSEVDISGTKVIGYSDVDNMAEGLFFARKDFAAGSGHTAVSLASPTVGAAFSSLDGLDRDDRVRYDTPRVMGTQLSASHVAGGSTDAAAQYVGKLGPVKLAAALGFAHAADSFNQYNGSVSALHESGLSATVAAGIRDSNAAARNTGEFWYAKLGYLFNPFAFGATALAIDYSENADILVNGDFGWTYGAFAVQNIDKAATELYAGVRNYSYDQKGANFEDILAVMSGARLKF